MIDPHSFDLIIFDCDGVLIDSEVLACKIDAEELTRIGYEISMEEVARRFTGLPSGAMRSEVERDWGRPLPPEFETNLRRRIREAFHRDLRAIPGIAEFIDTLAVPICVASSSAPDKLRLGLELTNLYGRFAPNIFSTTMVARGKPAPDLFLFAARKMGVEPARCIVIEDSIAGVEAGVAAGMRVVGFTGGGHCGPDHTDRLLRVGAFAIADHAARLDALLAMTVAQT